MQLTALHGPAQWPLSRQGPGQALPLGQVSGQTTKEEGRLGNGGASPMEVEKELIQRV